MKTFICELLSLIFLIVAGYLAFNIGCALMDHCALVNGMI